MIAEAVEVDRITQGKWIEAEEKGPASEPWGWTAIERRQTRSW